MIRSYKHIVFAQINAHPEISAHQKNSDFSKRGAHKTNGLWWVIFQRGGGGTQNQWVMMGDFSKGGGVHKTDGFWKSFLLPLKLSARGVYFGKYGKFTILEKPVENILKKTCKIYVC